MRAAFLAVILASTGCIEDELVQCGTDLCPARSVCTPGGCALPTQVTACANAFDGAACTTDRIATGTCWSGACREAACGNSAVDTEAGEVCDDGNRDYGDGCAGDCRSLETCGNGVVDRAVGEECDDGNLVEGDACRATCVVPRCGDAIVDTQNGEGCDAGTANSNAGGSTCRTNCQPQRCGDQVLDPGEVCDDGNLAPGDDCSGDCVSLEVCGNAYVDVVNDEQCDDTHVAGLSGDGCTSTCTIEIDLWRETTPGPPPARESALMVYDSVRDRLVMFGGAPGLQDTWEFDGFAWHMARPAVEPQIFYGTGLVFDPARGVTVLVSWDAQAVWEWDGSEWRDVTPNALPTPRHDYGLAYHTASQRVVMFGGRSSFTQLAETWLWDGVSWTNAAPALSPPPSDVLAMAANPVGPIVLYVGGQYPRNETWHWLGTNWERVTLIGDAPYLNQTLPMIYNGTNMVMFTTNSLEEKYVYTGTGWNLAAPDGGAVIRGSALAFNTDTGRMFSFGGDMNFDPSNVLRELRFGTWRLVDARVSPPALAGAGLVYDSLRGRVLTAAGGTGFFFTILNGTYATTNSSQTWAYVDERWERLPIGPAPKVVYVHSAFDPLRDRMVLFGGLKENRDPSNETWELVDTTWTKQPPATSPPASSGANMVFDLEDGVALLFEPTDLGKVWEWNGTDWAQRAAIAGPSLRVGGSLAYDTHRDRVVLHGGIVNNAVVNETWEYDDSTWTLVTTLNASPRYEGSLVYDPVRQETVLVGGFTDTSSRTDEAPWSWNGARWKRIPTPFVPSVVAQPMLAYDAVRGRILSYGGRDPTNFAFSLPAVIETWSLTSGSSSNPRDTCSGSNTDDDGDGRAGCADPDCWGSCSPLCPPSLACDPTWPRCGDGVCSAVEAAATCPADC